MIPNSVLSAGNRGGRESQQSAEQPELTEIPKTKKPKTGLIIAIVAGVLVIAAVIAFLLIWNSTENRMNRAISAGDMGEALTVYYEDYDGAELPGSTLSLLQERLDAIYPAFDAGEIDYEEARSTLDTLASFSDPAWNEQVDAAINLVNAARMKNGGSYYDAIQIYRDVLSQYPDSEFASSGLEDAISRYRNMILSGASSYMEEGEYDSAKEFVQNAIEFLGGDETLEAQLDEIDADYALYQEEQEAQTVSEVTAEVERLLQEGSYEEAQSYLEEQAAEYPDNPALQESLANLEQTIADAIAQDADEMAAGGAYGDALELLEEYMPLYGSLEESYLAIYNSMPITLENINTVSSERIEVVDEALKDRWNNIYDGGVRFQINYDDSYALYNLGGQFTAFEGTVFVGMDDGADGLSFSIYLDEELVFHRDGIMVETEPISIALDVTGKQTMRITTSGNYSWTWAGEQLTFGNTSFTRAEESESSQPSAEGQAEQSQPPAESQA